MMPWALDDRAVCAAIMACAALLLRMRPRSSVPWLVLLVAGLANALILNLLPHNRVSSNFVHQYLGSKYVVPYTELYRAVNAALERPQMDIRDLEHPPDMWRSDPREQRAYLLDLLRAHGSEFDATLPLDSLLSLAQASGAIREEAEDMLARCLPPDEIPAFRSDVRAAVDLVHGRELTDDYGFNGSPFYALVRGADPFLHVPLRPAAAVADLLAQVLSVFLLAWLAGRALELDRNERLATMVLLFASWTVTGWLLPGLVFAWLWLPVMLALLAMRRDREASAGVALAWASLVKLFPAFLLVLPISQRRWRMIFSFVVTILVLGGAALLSGRSWVGFLEKIVVQFEGSAHLVNSVSLSQWLLALGAQDSPLSIVVSALVLASVATLVWKDRHAGIQVWPRRALVLLSLLGWMTHTWFNYYAIVPLFLLPLLSRRHPTGSAVAAAALAFSYLLPGFGDPVLLGQRAWLALKVTPYLAIPMWMLTLELRASPPAIPRRVLATAGVVVVMAVAGDVSRVALVRHLGARGEVRLDRDDAALALVDFNWQIRLAPRNGPARMNRGIALAMSGREGEAGGDFARAVELMPNSIEARRNYARWLKRAGLPDEAQRQLQEALAAAPYDDDLRVDLARLLMQQGRSESALEQLARARELNPQNRAAREALAGVR